MRYTAQQCLDHEFIAKMSQPAELGKQLPVLESAINNMIHFQYVCFIHYMIIIINLSNWRLTSLWLDNEYCCSLIVVPALLIDRLKN